MKKYCILVSFLCAVALNISADVIPANVGSDVLKAKVSAFNADDYEHVKNDFPNDKAEEFLLKNIPLFDCPDEELRSVYYFRWWTFRKHLRKYPDVGWIISEFLQRVNWGGKYNAISCASGLQLREARWLRDSAFASEFANYWCYYAGERARYYSSWIATSALDVYAIDGNLENLKKWYPKLKENFAAWERDRFDNTLGMFWQIDCSDGMELSASGQLHMRWQGYRATINSYMYSECASLSKIATLLGNAEDAAFYSKKAAYLKEVVNKKLWDNSAKFYMVRPMNGSAEIFSPHRELHGYTPWYFYIPPKEYSIAWKQVLDEKGFKAPFGLTSLERRSPLFQLNYVGHECQWNGPVWPYATSITLSGMANFLRAYDGAGVLTKDDFYDALKTYAKAHHRVREDGKRVFWIDENIHPFTGDWISRTRLKKWVNGDWDYKQNWYERGKDYNHSFYAELIIRDIAGIMPNGTTEITIDPLAPDSWKFFAVDGVRVLDKQLSVIWDKDGSRYGKGKGFAVFVNGKEVLRKQKLEKVNVSLK